MVTELKDHFTLDSIASFLKTFRLPKKRFDSEGQWRAVYGAYTLAGRGGRAGRLVIERKRVSKDEFVLDMAYEKNLPGHVQHITAQMHCSSDALSTPLRWIFSSEIQVHGGGVLADSKVKKSATAEKGRIRIVEGKHEELIAVQAGWTVNWALFDGVQRLPRKTFEPIEFVMFDHFDQLKRSQRISYREKINVTLGEQVALLHGFDHLGEGIVPWVYWVDEEGRLLFVVSGLEAYIRETEA